MSKLNDDKCNDIASSVWNLAVYTGETFGPLFGGYITHVKSFKQSCLWVSFINFAYGGFYFYQNIEYIAADIKNGYSFAEINRENDNKDDEKAVVFNTRTNSIMSDFCDTYYNLKVPHSNTRKNSNENLYNSFRNF